jgi:hypothetical protein
VHLLMLIPFGRSPEPVRVSITFAIATDESRVCINHFEILQLLGPYAIRQVIHGAINQRTDEGLVLLADLAKLRWIIL